MKILEQIRLKRLNISRLDCLVIDEADLIPVCGYGKHMQTLRTFLPKQPIQVQNVIWHPFILGYFDVCYIRRDNLFFT